MREKTDIDRYRYLFSLSLDLIFKLINTEGLYAVNEFKIKSMHFHPKQKFE